MLGPTLHISPDAGLLMVSLSGMLSLNIYEYSLCVYSSMGLYTADSLGRSKY